jgi:hypothetical protein
MVISTQHTDEDSLVDDADSPLKHNPFEKLGKLLKDKAVMRPLERDIVHFIQGYLSQAIMHSLIIE